jgi:hypothetical protein
MHHIDSPRQTIRYIRAYYREVGYVQSMLAINSATGKRATLKKIIRTLSSGIADEALCLVETLGSNQSKRVKRLRTAALKLGEARAGIELFLKPHGTAFARSSEDG